MTGASPDEQEPRFPPSPSRKAAVLLRATASEVAGAAVQVAGLPVAERSLKQIDRLGYAIVLASDGSCRLPMYLPAGVVVRRVPKPDDLAALRKEMPGAIEIPADEVRPSSKSLAGGMRVVDEISRRRAEDAIFAELVRGDLGFVARHLNKPVSFFITRRLLCHLPLTPNQVSLGAALLGLAGATLIASGHYALMIWGFFLAHVQSVLDGCDGELARVRLQQSTLGEWLDSLIDDSLNILIFAGLGIGFYRATHVSLYLEAGLLAAAMHLFYDVVALREMARQGQGGEIIKLKWRITGAEAMKTRLHHRRSGLLVALYTLGRRDFYILAFLIYALVGLAKLTLLHAVLIAGPLFVVALTQLLWRLRGSPA
ncbi:MAG: CDP-alcohol phosphatidyltransferase family protein [Polyangia bacterium]